MLLALTVEAGARNQGMQETPRSYKDKESDSPLEPAEWTQPLAPPFQLTSINLALPTSRA